MAILKVIPPKVTAEYSSHHGRQGEEAPSQAWLDGNLISPNALGQFIESPIGAAAVGLKHRLSTVIGQQLAVPVRRTEFVNPNTALIFEITAGGAAATNVNIRTGLTYGLGKDANGAHFMNLTDTVNAIFRVEDNLVRAGVLGADTNVRVLVSLLPASR